MFLFFVSVLVCFEGFVVVVVLFIVFVCLFCYLCVCGFFSFFSFFFFFFFWGGGYFLRVGGISLAQQGHVILFHLVQLIRVSLFSALKP